MPRFNDWEAAQEVADIMEGLIERFPTIFEGLDMERIGFVKTKNKKSDRAIKVKGITYPTYVFTGKVYIVEVFDMVWKDLDQKRKNLAVFHILCALPVGAFDEESKNYGKVRKPEISMYMTEFAASGGVPNWM